MNRLSACIMVVVVGLGSVMATEAFAKKKMTAAPVLLTPEDIQWKQLAGAPPGVMSAVVRGSDAKGPYGGFTKFPAGFQAPLHYHTYATTIVVIKGAYVYKGKSYGPGSYLAIPGGDRHVSGGAADSETIFFIEQPGKFDLVPVKEK